MVKRYIVVTTYSSGVLVGCLVGHILLASAATLLWQQDALPTVGADAGRLALGLDGKVLSSSTVAACV